jgi:hypothetical protein
MAQVFKNERPRVLKKRHSISRARMQLFLRNCGPWHPAHHPLMQGVDIQDKAGSSRGCLTDLTAGRNRIKSVSHFLEFPIFPMKKTLLFATALAALSTSHAVTVVSINFVGNAGVAGELAAGDVAGLPNAQSPVPGVNTFVPNWNNVSGNSASGSAGGIVTSTATSTGASVAWTTDLGGWSLPDTLSGANNTANRTMMKGYLDAASAASVTVSGLTGADFTTPYTVIVYFDGDNGGSWRVGNYSISGNTLGGEDSEGVNFNAGGLAGGNENPDGLFQIPVAGGPGNVVWPVAGGNNGEGNYVVFTGVTGSSFTINAGGGASADIPRAPINGFQIIAVPEPSAAFFAALAFSGMMMRRRR